MGFLSRTRQATGHIVNFKVQNWLALDYIKGSFLGLFRLTKNIFTIQQAERTESFAEAKERLGLSDAEIKTRIKEFTRLFIFYLVVAALIFSYSIYIAIFQKNILGFFMGLGVTIFSLSHAFRYHFWLFQIKHQKLGCSIRDWFFDNK